MMRKIPMILVLVLVYMLGIKLSESDIENIQYSIWLNDHTNRLFCDSICHKLKTKAIDTTRICLVSHPRKDNSVLVYLVLTEDRMIITTEKRSIVTNWLELFPGILRDVPALLMDQHGEHATFTLKLSFPDSLIEKLHLSTRVSLFHLVEEHLNSYLREKNFKGELILEYIPYSIVDHFSKSSQELDKSWFVCNSDYLILLSGDFFEDQYSSSIMSNLNNQHGDDLTFGLLLFDNISKMTEETFHRDVTRVNTKIYLQLTKLIFRLETFEDVFFSDLSGSRQLPGGRVFADMFDRLKEHWYSDLGKTLYIKISDPQASKFTDKEFFDELKAYFLSLVADEDEIDEDEVGFYAVRYEIDADEDELNRSGNLMESETDGQFKLLYNASGVCRSHDDLEDGKSEKHYEYFEIKTTEMFLKMISKGMTHMKVCFKKDNCEFPKEAKKLKDMTNSAIRTYWSSWIKGFITYVNLSLQGVINPSVNSATDLDYKEYKKLYGIFLDKFILHADQTNTFYVHKDILSEIKYLKQT